MSIPLEDIRMAFDNLRQHKLRSLLTILGVIIGTMTVIVISGLLSGIKVGVAKEIESFGANSIYIYKFDPGFRGQPDREERMRKPISYEDALAIKQECPSVADASPFISPVDYNGGRFTQRVNIRYRETEMINSTVSACLPGYFNMGTTDLDEGRYFTEGENNHRADVVVIGADVANSLFPTTSPLDKDIIIVGRNFRVIGVLKKRDTFLIGSDDPNNENKTVYLPYESLLKLYPNLKDNFVVAQAKLGQSDEAVEEIRQLLRRRRKVPFGEPDNFGVQTADSLISQFNSITAGIAIIIVTISSVGLLVGGIGVMNIMLVSVTERTREIGIRKAIGARRRDIVIQFLMESATLTGFGGVVGVLLGWAFVEVVKNFLPTYIPLWAPLAGLLVSVGLGIICGLWPAWKAANLDPIEALRYE